MSEEMLARLIASASKRPGQRVVLTVDVRQGGTYKVSRLTPIMPTPHPGNVLKALKRVVHLQPGDMFTVHDIVTMRRAVWYKVRRGYINRLALIGQDLTRVLQKQRKEK